MRQLSLDRSFGSPRSLRQIENVIVYIDIETLALREVVEPGRLNGLTSRGTDLQASRAREDFSGPRADRAISRVVQPPGHTMSHKKSPDTIAKSDHHEPRCACYMNKALFIRLNLLRIGNELSAYAIYSKSS